MRLFDGAKERVRLVESFKKLKEKAKFNIQQLSLDFKAAAMNVKWNDVKRVGGRNQQIRREKMQISTASEGERDGVMAGLLSSNELRCAKEEFNSRHIRPPSAGRHITFIFWCSANSWAAWKYGYAANCKSIQISCHASTHGRKGG